MKQDIDKSYNAIYRDERVELRQRHFGWPKHREEALIKWAGSGQRALEIGFGSGTVLYNLRDRFDELFGVELSFTRASTSWSAFRNAGVSNVHIVSGNVEQGLPFVDRYFDCIIWADVIEHVVDLWSGMAEVQRVLKPGGRLITSTPNIAELRRRLRLLMGVFPSTSGCDEGLTVRKGELFDGGHMHYFTFSSLEHLYQKYGIQPVKRYGFGNAGRFHNIYPPLLSGSVFVIGKKCE